MVILSLDHAQKLGLVLLLTISALSAGTNAAPLTDSASEIAAASSVSLDTVIPQAVSQPALFNTIQGSLDDEEEDDDQQQFPDDDEEREADIVQISKIKQPNTPPKSLPSDPYAHYTYEEDYAPVPGSLKPGQKARRTMVVGDVHGSLAGLNAFLKQIKFDASQDEIIFAGDMVAKGPQSLQVIDKAIELQARCVRGNHDDKVLRWRGYLDSLAKNKKLPIPSDLEENSEHHEIAKKMTKAQYKYLVSCPLILTIPKELSARKIPIHVVHAGIDPSDNLSKQLPWVLVNVRNILKDGTPSRKKKKGEGWAQQFNDFHSKRVKQGEPDFLLIYGHDAGRSLNVKTWSVGLDTGCVYGRKLSTYVVETGNVYSTPCPDLGLGDDED
ncbi:hypothetical protein EC991_011267 [Linnemannia zychae]|nr:hypothetical protein EC991_011267 [Linnemannia zychae]